VIICFIIVKIERITDRLDSERVTRMWKILSSNPGLLNLTQRCKQFTSATAETRCGPETKSSKMEKVVPK